MNQYFTRGTSSFFYFYLLLPIVLNVAFPFNQLVTEGLIIGDRDIAVHQVDLWIASEILGGYNRDGYVTFLLASYTISLVLGVLVAYVLTVRVFRTILERNELTVGAASLILRLTLDLLAAGFFAAFGYNILLSYLLGHGGVDVFSSSSLFVTYTLAGFVTGSAVWKLTFPWRVWRKCRKQRLTLRAEMFKPTKTADLRTPARIQFRFVNDSRAPH